MEIYRHRGQPSLSIADAGRDSVREGDDWPSHGKHSGRGNAALGS